MMNSVLTFKETINYILNDVNASILEQKERNADRKLNRKVEKSIYLEEKLKKEIVKKLMSFFEFPEESSSESSKKKDKKKDEFKPTDYDAELKKKLDELERISNGDYSSLNNLFHPVVEEEVVEMSMEEFVHDIISYAIDKINDMEVLKNFSSALNKVDKKTTELIKSYMTSEFASDFESNVLNSEVASEIKKEMSSDEFISRLQAFMKEISEEVESDEEENNSSEEEEEKKEESSSDEESSNEEESSNDDDLYTLPKEEYDEIIKSLQDLTMEVKHLKTDNASLKGQLTKLKNKKKK